MYNKNIDKNELESEYHWVIFTQEEFERITNTLKEYKEKYQKLSEYQSNPISDWDQGVAWGFKMALELLEFKYQWR